MRKETLEMQGDGGGEYRQLASSVFPLRPFTAVLRDLVYSVSPLVAESASRVAPRCSPGTLCFQPGAS